MRSAPSVVYPVGRCVFHGRILFALSAFGLAVLVGWVWSASGRFFEEAIWAGFCLWVLWSVWVFKAWWRTPVGALHWDSLAAPTNESLRAGAWWWYDDTMDDGVVVLDIECVLDCQSWILLRWRRSPRWATWVWAERGRAPEHWGDLRRALMASRGR